MVKDASKVMTENYFTTISAVLDDQLNDTTDFLSMEIWDNGHFADIYMTWQNLALAIDVQYEIMLILACLSSLLSLPSLFLERLLSLRIVLSSL